MFALYLVSLKINVILHFMFICKMSREVILHISCYPWKIKPRSILVKIRWPRQLSKVLTKIFSTETWLSFYFALSSCSSIFELFWRLSSIWILPPILFQVYQGWINRLDIYAPNSIVLNLILTYLLWVSGLNPNSSKGSKM